ncbi:M48 family metallopeptidase [Aurantiacibacter luteus]|uniref:Metal-dependent hydrolase n=1 Tax=Aurantiacibacter luteus TaxID=1581420 RepID=A0A0G9MVB8_9SPHN|nr:YgjP-like metallopeptidase domain-containing protein [Aurantiacibacter luteus]KLE34692.1 metal-dependent hydrolase [Aurantiacibacter luteus]
MIDWLRKEIREPSVEVAGRTLPIAIRRHARARRLTMRLAPDGSELRVTLPRWGRTLDAIAFAEARREWIAGQLAKMVEARPIGDGASVPYRGEDLTVRWDAGALRKVVREGDGLTIGGPQESLPTRLQRWLEGEALRLAAEDLADYCARIHHPLPDLRLTRAQRRWGSCSGHVGEAEVRRIRLNWRLVMAPDHVRRSVVAHEVAHLVHFDHSPAFHDLLARLYEGNLEAADDWLKQQGRSLYAMFG